MSVPCLQGGCRLLRNQAELCLQLHSCTYSQMGQIVSTVLLLFQSANKNKHQKQDSRSQVWALHLHWPSSLLCTETSMCYSGCHIAPSPVGPRRGRMVSFQWVADQWGTHRHEGGTEGGPVWTYRHKWTVAQSGQKQQW